MPRHGHATSYTNLMLPHAASLSHATSTPTSTSQAKWSSLDGKAPLTKREKGSSLGGMRKPAMSGSVEVGSGAHMSRKDARTGRIATVRRSGVMYAIAPVMRGTFRVHAVHTQCTRSAHAVHTQRRQQSSFGPPSHLVPDCVAIRRRGRRGRGACR